MAKHAHLLLAALALAGCSSVTGGLFKGKSSQATTATATDGKSAEHLSAEGLALYLKTMRDLVEGDAVLQADTFRNAQMAAESSPTTTNRLNYALALATPGHPSSNPLEAQRRLNELLADGNALLPEERILATVHLKEVEQRLILDAEAQRLQHQVEAATTERNDQNAQRLQAALEENRQLRLELDQAREKLDAIINIERSTRERENANPQ
jgi:uncharacterized lipoprotein YmbA